MKNKGKMGEKTRNNDNRHTLLSFLPILRSNQEFYMRQQWTITNYSFLIYGAIIGIIKLFDLKISCNEKILAFSVSTLVCVAAAFFIQKLHDSLEEVRLMVNDIYNEIPILKNIVEKSSKKTAPISSWLFIVILILGNIAVLWVILRIQ